MRPDLRQVERVDVITVGVLLRHDLHADPPFREVSVLDVVEQIALKALAILADDLFGLRVGQVSVALHRLEVEFHPDALVVLVDQAEGMAAVAVHLAVVLRQAPVAHRDRDLMQRFRQQGPEVPVVVGAAHVGLGIALHRMVQVRELQRIAQEEDRRVVADHVPVAFLGIEFDGEAADVAFGVGRAALTGDGGEAGEHVGLLAHLGQELGAGVLRDVVGHREGAERARPFRMHPPLWNHLAVEMRQLLQKPHILHQQGAAGSGSH
jgi:hypothetical protein